MLSTYFWLPVNEMSEGPKASVSPAIEGSPVTTRLVRTVVSNQRDRTGKAEARRTESLVLDATCDRAASARLDDVEVSVGREGQVARVVQARGDDLGCRLCGSR